jgi:protein-L-isoaspartate(D-aspartate) O-methyltransferase
MDSEVALTGLGSKTARRALMAPRTLAKLIQLAAIEPEDAVLAVGAATGYGAAIMARLGDTVIALESDEGLAERARQTLEGGAARNVAVVTGDLAMGSARTRGLTTRS